MKNIYIFEDVIYQDELAIKFYFYCLKRNFKLINYLFVNLFYYLLFITNLINSKKYYEKNFRYLKKIPYIENLIKNFFIKNKSLKFKLINKNDNDVFLISEYPKLLLENLLVNKEITLISNYYDIKNGFKNFKNKYNFIEGIKKTESNICVFSNYNSKFKKYNNINFQFIYGEKIFKNPSKYYLYIILHNIFLMSLLVIFGALLGIISMYLGSAYLKKEMFLSYFKIDYLVFFNLLPIILLVFLNYYIFNKIWISFFISSSITILLSWVNYLKLFYRNDPLYFIDLKLFFESYEMLKRYDLKIDLKLILTLIAFIILTITIKLFEKKKSTNLKFRFIFIIFILSFWSISFKNFYMNDKFYNNTENYSLINRWSSSEVYISRGFIYPFIYSYKLSKSTPPQGYSKKETLDFIENYNYDDIKENKKVNVVSVMLEAYNDFSKFENIEFNKDIYKYFHELEKNSYSGELVTNVFAGGTINTERSFLTGYSSLINFRKNVNSYVRYFNEQGYKTEGSHPCYDWFYNRKNVNSYLGFDEYHFFEDYYYKFSDGKIPNDNILLNEIIKLYEKSKKPYFSFNVTYQNHGPYSAEKTKTEYIISKGYNKKNYNIFNNYLEGIYDTTKELEKFINYFEKQNEPVVIILFGDHNPWLGENNSVYKDLGINIDLSTEEGFYNYYNTPYIIWANKVAKNVLDNDFKGNGNNISPNFLMNEFFKLANYKGNEYIKISNNIKKSLEIIHIENKYKENNNLTSELSKKTYKNFQEFIKAQYYLKTVFK
jgi:phosphoglycerol transferase MdoB-like AlkP superfamily enzyme